MSERPQLSARRRLESGFGALGGVIGRNPWHFIVAIGLLTICLLAPLWSLRVDTSFVGMLPPDDPSLRVLDRFRSYFGCPEQAVLAVRPRAGLFSDQGMGRLAALHSDIESHVPLVANVRSLVNARDTRGEGDELIVGELLEEWPDSPDAWRRVRERALANPLYQDLLVSRSGEWALIAIEPDPRLDVNPFDSLAGFDAPSSSGSEVESGSPSITSQQMIEMTSAIEVVLERHRDTELEIVAGGGVVMGAVLAEGIERDFGFLLGLAFAVIALLLYVFVRSAAMVSLVLLVVLFSLAGSIGLMAAFGVPLDVGTQILPAFLLAVGVGYAVHLIEIFNQRLPLSHDKRLAVRESMEHSAFPILLTALTTAGGLFAFSFAGLAPLERIGAFGPVGVILAALYDLLLLPALLVVLPVEPPRARTSRVVSSRVLEWFCVVSVRCRYGILVSLAVLLALAAGQAGNVEISHNPLHWLPEDSEFRRANNLLDRDFGGGYQLELIVQAKEGHSLRDPVVLQSMRRLSDALGELETEHVRTSSVVALNDIVEEIHQALLGGALDARLVASDPQVVAQELLLFENAGTDDLEDVVDSSFMVGRMSVRVNYADAHHMTEFLDRVEALAARHLGTFADIESTGLFAISHRAFSVLLDGMLRSYLVALTIIGLMMLLLVGRLREGLLAAIPNLSPILLTLGLMGTLGIPLDMFTLLVGSIALGLAVDDTIHFTHVYLRSRENGMGSNAAIAHTLHTTGAALFITSVALVLGFSVFALASLDCLMAFGLLASTAIALALLCDMLVLPALLAVAEDYDAMRRVRREAKSRPTQPAAANR